MKFNNLLKLDQIRLNITAGSKKKVLQVISDIVAENHPEYNANKIFELLIERERLGSTGIGHGVALPHGRLPDCQEPIGIFISLAEGVDFDAIDQEPVKLLFALLVPENSTQEHLEILARLADFFRQDKNRQILENATSPETVYNLLINI